MFPKPWQPSPAKAAVANTRAQGAAERLERQGAGGTHEALKLVRPVPSDTAPQPFLIEAVRFAPGGGCSVERE